MKKNQGSVLFEAYKLSPNLTIINDDTVNGPCFVIGSDGNNGIVSFGKKRNIWAEAFTKIYAKDI